MDLLLVLAIPVVLALAALRWGADSREGFVSEEECLARYGVVWDATPANPPRRHVVCGVDGAAVDGGAAASPRYGRLSFYVHELRLRQAKRASQAG